MTVFSSSGARRTGWRRARATAAPALATAALYALLLQALLGAIAAPLAAPFERPCRASAAASSEPSGERSAHDEAPVACCLVACIHVLVAPPTAARPVAWPSPRTGDLAWRDAGRRADQPAPPGPARARAPPVV